MFVKSALKFSAVCVAVDIGLFRSEVLSTFPNPTFALVRLAKLAFKSNAVCCC